MQAKILGMGEIVPFVPVLLKGFEVGFFPFCTFEVSLLILVGGFFWEGVYLFALGFLFGFVWRFFCLCFWEGL